MRDGFNRNRFHRSADPGPELRSSGAPGDPSGEKQRVSSAVYAQL